MMDNFYKDLNRGFVAEYYILDLIKKKYPSAYKMEGYFKEYDIDIPELNKTVEVKFDEMSLSTGNLVVEVEFDGKPSAISTTTADYWVFVSSEFDMWIKPNRILDCISYYNIQIRTFIGDGDTKEKKAYLVPISKLKKYCIKIKSKLK